LIKFYNFSKVDNKFLINNKKLDTFLSDVSLMCNDVIQENYYEEYRTNFSMSDYGFFENVQVNSNYFVSEELLDRMIFDYNNQNLLSTDKSIFTATNGKQLPFDEWSEDLKKAWKKNIKKGFSWGIDSKHVSLFEYKDLHTNLLFKDKKIPLMFNPTNSRTSFYQEMDVVKNVLQSEFPNNNVKKSGGFWYKPNYYMGWHNNQGKKGTRIYVTYADENGKSFFRYKDNKTNKIITTYDQKGWTIRMFDVSDKIGDFYWHCVYSKCNRFSFGFNIEGE
jgi:hypothetical protein|tara:strand:+ start:2359 stop:3189 length:831 start_codon:yes stop_codon:yes gene_type:complete